MLFNSWQYGIFLPVVFGIYWLLPHRLRWILLFVASYYFYMSWNAKYVVLILFTTIVSYIAAILIEYRKNVTCTPPQEYADFNIDGVFGDIICIQIF